jgi:hypothetical protein
VPQRGEGGVGEKRPACLCYGRSVWDTYYLTSIVCPLVLIDTSVSAVFSQKWEINEGGAGFENPSSPQPQERGGMRSFGDHPNDSTPAVSLGRGVSTERPSDFPPASGLAGAEADADAYNQIGSICQALFASGYRSGNDRGPLLKKQQPRDHRENTDAASG